MNRRNGSAGADGSPLKERAGSAASSARADASPASSTTSTASSGVQFLPLRSRIGKRYQATLPELRTERPTKMTKIDAIPKTRYDQERANALGADLDKYLKLAFSLRDGAACDTREEITAMALSFLHRFEYHPMDAACALYAQHSIEVPRPALASEQHPQANGSSSNNKPAEQEARWLSTFYRLLRLRSIQNEEIQELRALFRTAKALALSNSPSTSNPVPEVDVLTRWLARVDNWMAKCHSVQAHKVERFTLQSLLYEADDMRLVVPEREAIQTRLERFEAALVKLKDAIDRTSRRNQPKVHLQELEQFFAAATSEQIAFEEEEAILRIVEDARELKATISSMLTADKVSLPAIRDVTAKLEVVPVNFEDEIGQLQQKMLSAQSWLAKARKCIPKRRATRRGGPEPKKMDLEAIRALVEDAPCDDSAEIFEMQDLLECADEWADKVKQAIENGSDMTLDQLKELLDEGNEMPVDMEEQVFLAGEIAAREWSTRATTLLADRKPLRELEDVVDQAKAIRTQLHPKRQSRWKPQIERDILAAIDTARRWVNEVRDTIGASVFDKLVPKSALSELGSSSSSSHGDKDKKKPIDTITKLIEKSERLPMDMVVYVLPLKQLVVDAHEAQQAAAALLDKVGWKKHKADKEDKAVAEQLEENKEKGDFGAAAALLETIKALPVQFDEGFWLEELVQSEKEWALSVHDALPPRQSRKKRLSSQQITLEHVEKLLKDADLLHFEFPEEIKLLKKELEDVASWQEKARDVVETRAPTDVWKTVQALKERDLRIHKTLEANRQATSLTGSTTDSQPDAEPMLATSTHPAPEETMKQEPSAMPTTQQVTSPRKQPTEDHQAAAESLKTETKAAMTESPMADHMWEKSRLEARLRPEAIEQDVIMNHIRKESGCARKETTVKDDDAAETKATSASLLDSLLDMVEESMTTITALEAKGDDQKQKKATGLDAVAIPKDDANSPDEAVKLLEQWGEQITRVLDDTSVLNVVPPEQPSLETIVKLLDWLQTARSIFYDESLPLKDLVATGNTLENALKEMRFHSALKDQTMEVLECMLWPLPFLTAQEKVVRAWTDRVTRCLTQKQASVADVQTLLAEGTALLMMDPDAFRSIFDEIKKTKVWLSKLKKRLKSLSAKNLTRLSMVIAKSLVDEGQDLVLEIPALALLKDHVETASDWEQRVLASGLETGVARIANLLSLLEEYNRADWIIDLDMHRDVLKSATERYCICRQPFDGLMIGCDFCDDWFHDTCIGMSKEKAEKVEHYTCPSCNILQDLQSLLARMAIDGGYTALYEANDYMKTLEKQQGIAQRKIKREEKAMERSEMLLYSCTNRIDQLRIRINDIERAKACLTIKHSVTSSGNTTPATTPTTMTSMDFTNRYPTILMPPPQPHRTAPPTQHQPISQATEAPAAPVAPTQAPPQPSQAAQTTEVPLPSKPAPAPAPQPAPASTPNVQPTIAVSCQDDEKKQDVGAITETIPTTVLTPILSKALPSDERLSALVVAGGVEEQLALMKSEMHEAQTQADEIHKSLQQSRERLYTAKSGLQEIQDAHVARQKLLPVAQLWVRKAVTTLNNVTALSRQCFVSTASFLPPVYEQLIEEGHTHGIDQFPEVRNYVRLLRCAAWSLVVVSLLQERSSRERITEAIAYANHHNLWDNKTIGPLKQVVGRVDAWISKAQKCISKAASTKAQKIARLKALMNEYSKLPLTCSWVHALEEYVRAVEMEVSDKVSMDLIHKTQVKAEAAAVAAITAAAAVCTPMSSSSSSSVASTANSSAPFTTKTPRKRKAYTRKEKPTPTSTPPTTKKPKTTAGKAGAKSPSS